MLGGSVRHELQKGTLGVGRIRRWFETAADALAHVLASACMRRDPARRPSAEAIAAQLRALASRCAASTDTGRRRMFSAMAYRSEVDTLRARVLELEAELARASASREVTTSRERSLIGLTQRTVIERELAVETDGDDLERVLVELREIFGNEGWCEREEGVLRWKSLDLRDPVRVTVESHGGKTRVRCDIYLTREHTAFTRGMWIGLAVAAAGVTALASGLMISDIPDIPYIGAVVPALVTSQIGLVGWPVYSRLAREKRARQVLARVLATLERASSAEREPVRVRVEAAGESEEASEPEAAAEPARRSTRTGG